MAVITVNRLSRNKASLIQTATLTSELRTAAFRAAGGTTLGTTGSTGVGTVAYDVDDKVAFFVTWAGTAAAVLNLKLTVAAGSDRRAWQRGQGAFSFFPAGASSGSSGTFIGKRWVVGPFETARFARKTTAGSTAAVGVAEGRNHIRFTLSATSSEGGQGGRVNIQAFRMPDVRYTT